MKRRFTIYPSTYVGAASETSGAAMRRKKREMATIRPEDAELLATDGNWELWTPLSFTGSVKLGNFGGQKAKWATSYEHHSYYYDRYTARGPLYIFINKSNPGEKYQWHPESNIFCDIDDRSLGAQAFEDFCCEHPAFADYFGIECV